jgi:hypothetical protein
MRSGSASGVVEGLRLVRGGARGVGGQAQPTSAGQCGACLAVGADGIFFATAGLGDGMFADEAYRRWAGRLTSSPLRAARLAGATSSTCTHAEGALRCRRAADYPVPIFSWSGLSHWGVDG